MQPAFDRLPGVISTVVGYTGGEKPDPTYEEVSTGRTGHVEAIRVTYDPAKIRYEELLETFWRNIDPTQKDGQFADRGSQYRTAIFYLDENQKRLAEISRENLERSKKFDRPIATEIRPAAAFYPAEEYHQKYYLKKPFQYKMYKVGSGRESFLRKTWGHTQP